jgi:hypothetical protein
MKRTIALILTLAIFSIGYSQISEVGGGLGVLSYSGDLQSGYRFLTNRPAATLHVRSHIQDHVSIKFGLTFGRVIGRDDPPEDAFATQRNASFRIFLVEGSAEIEYDFLDFKGYGAPYRWTPYFFTGAGLFTFFGQDDRNGTYSNVQPVIPLGFGFKYLYNPRWIIGIKFGARLTFFDYLDNISDSDRSRKTYQYGNSYTNDKYYFVGITLNYSFYSIPCPFPLKRPFRN